MGTEWEGVSPRMLEAADHHVRIPMRGFAESLNISVAAAVALHELTRRMRSSMPEQAWQLSDEERATLLDLWAFRSVRGAEAILRRAGLNRPEFV
jgi:tRNA (guanosine-2'-O-)-methyltransferase